MPGLCKPPCVWLTCSVLAPDRVTGSQGRSRVSSLDMWLPEAAVAPPPPAASPAGPLPQHKVAIRLQAAPGVHRQHRCTWHSVRTLFIAAFRACMLCAGDCPHLVSLMTIVPNGATGPATQPGHGPTAGHERRRGLGRSAGHTACLSRWHEAGTSCRPPGADRRLVGTPGWTDCSIVTSRLHTASDCVWRTDGDCGACRSCDLVHMHQAAAQGQYK